MCCTAINCNLLFKLKLNLRKVRSCSSRDNSRQCDLCNDDLSLTFSFEKNYIFKLNGHWHLLKLNVDGTNKQRLKNFISVNLCRISVKIFVTKSVS